LWWWNIISLYQIYDQPNNFSDYETPQKLFNWLQIQLVVLKYNISLPFFLYVSSHSTCKRVKRKWWYFPESLCC
jgi:hypothetical protein